MPKPSSPLSGINLPKQKSVSNGPLWAGPEGEGPQGGVTFSLLNKFLGCRERFRVRVIEGLRSVDSFNHRMEYGNMWHICEEALASGKDWGGSGAGGPLGDYAKELCKLYPLSQDDIEKWYLVCRNQFPVYVDYWAKHPDIANRTPLLSEKPFDVLYTLPSGRKVRLRGKWDSVDLVKDKKTSSIWLQENKTKGDVDQIALSNQLSFDLQSMMYLVALGNGCPMDTNGDRNCGKPACPFCEKQKVPIAGVRYNVIRRPLSGGKGTIKQLSPTKKNPQGESKSEFYARLRGIIAESPNEFFFRWNVDVTPQDLLRFRTECLDPILEGLCHWYDWVIDCHFRGTSPFLKSTLHWRHPFGCSNPIDEYGASDVDAYIDTGSTIGLERATTLFRELE